MNKYGVIIGVATVIIVGGVWAVQARVAKAPGPQACTAEAKLCPDGSAVGRTGPNCEFAACPALVTAGSPLAIGASVIINGTLIGVLSLVEDSRCPSDVKCIQAGTVRVRASIEMDNNDFTFTLGQPQVVGNATITLVSVIPAQRSSQQTLQPSDYRFIFSVMPKVTSIPGGGKACTMDAKLCPDGSYVGRTGPNCEFVCPNTSGVSGTVSLGPTCPVQRIPPDPACAEKPYATAIVVYHTGSTVTVATGKSDATGAFAFPLPPGLYTLKATGSTMLPRCSPVDVTVTAGGYATTNISCDTGIR